MDSTEPPPELNERYSDSSSPSPSPTRQFTHSRHSQLADFKILLRTLEHTHRASLAQHLLVAARLCGRADNDGQDDADELTRRRRIVHPRWTAWPLPSDELPMASSEKYDVGQDIDYLPSSSRSKRKRDQITSDRDGQPQPILDEPQGEYEHYRLSSYKFVTLDEYAAPLVAEISSLGIRALTDLAESNDNTLTGANVDLENILFSNSDIEKSLLLPYLHPNIMHLIDSLFDAVVAVRTSQGTSASRSRLGQLDWRDILSLAALSGMPAFDNDDDDDDAKSNSNGNKNSVWSDVVNQVSQQCQVLFGDGPRFEVLQNEGKVRAADLPGQAVREKGYNS
ncbi:uncharacterized protein V2V93DRAFT_245835 [Kockiozyma suomiensis]|uniref:uncharacterized protein n=1 Tax=Kockiozyma suomiensis TaxID=1337062 RepID=UPI0033432B02